MNYQIFEQLNKKIFFTIQDVSNILRVKESSARVICSRYYNKGFFVRLKKNFYITSQKWQILEISDFFKLSNLLQVPSYISLMTALCYYGITTQVQRNFFESICVKRTVDFDMQGVLFNYYKINENYYFGWVKENNIFIALKEKAFLDTIYLYSFGKYSIDFSSLDLNKLDKEIIKDMLKKYPEKTKRIVKRCMI